MKKLLFIIMLASILGSSVAMAKTEKCHKICGNDSYVVCYRYY